MRLARLVVLCVALLAALPARADIAGQVLTVVGEALALRAGQILRLFPGAAIESGDQIHTGPDSHVEIRFTDWGAVSLRARTDFVVDDYVYEARQGGRERAFFSLLNGGVRSLTGLIGRRDHSNYLLRSPIATIGIRGTHFSVLVCKHDCNNPDGSLGEDGLYGGVIEGRIAVSPYGSKALEREFRAGEYFRLADEKSAPTPLFSPPQFFWNRLDPQASGGGRPIAGVPGALPGGDPVSRAGGGLVPIVSTLPVSEATTIAPLAEQIVLPAANLAGSAVNSALSMPALGPAVSLIGSALNAVPAVVAPVPQAVVSTLTSGVSVPPVTGLPPVTALPPVTTLPPVTVPTPVTPLPPVTAPTPPVTTLPPVTAPTPPTTTLPPVTAPTPPATTLPPVTAPAPPATTLPPVTAPAPPTTTLPPITAPTPPGTTLPPIAAPTPPAVALPTPPSLPLSKALSLPYRR